VAARRLVARSLLAASHFLLRPRYLGGAGCNICFCAKADDRLQNNFKTATMPSAHVRCSSTLYCIAPCVASTLHSTQPPHNVHKQATLLTSPDTWWKYGTRHRNCADHGTPDTPQSCCLSFQPSQEPAFARRQGRCGSECCPTSSASQRPSQRSAPWRRCTLGQCSDSSPPSATDSTGATSSNCFGPWGPPGRSCPQCLGCTCGAQLQGHAPSPPACHAC